MLDGEEDSGEVKILWDYSESIGGHCLWVISTAYSTVHT